MKVYNLKYCNIVFDVLCKAFSLIPEGLMYKKTSIAKNSLICQCFFRQKLHLAADIFHVQVKTGPTAGQGLMFISH